MTDARHKLHKIRESIHNKRCLQHFAPHAFPQELKPDTRLIWYFQTRAAIFADIRFNLQKRNVILLLCFSLSMILSLLALLAVNLRWTAQRSSILCYGFAHGVASALILVLYIVFGSRVNGELDRGIETLQALYFNVEEGQDDSPKTPKKIKKPSHTDGIVSPLPSDPTPDQVCRRVEADNACKFDCSIHHLHRSRSSLVQSHQHVPLPVANASVTDELVTSLYWKPELGCPNLRLCDLAGFRCGSSMHHSALDISCLNSALL
eukprot:Skav227718  [mRNA]  locus=scaffold802:43167:44798:- [translate_table: standard]